MSEENTSPDESTAPAESPVEDNRIPYDRFEKVNKEAKAAKAELAEIKRLMQERDEAGMPELEQFRKRAEANEKRALEAEQRAEAAERSVQSQKRDQWITAAALAEGFVNPSRAARLVDDLDSIEDAGQAEKAVKRLAKSDGYLLKQPDSPLPGKVLENGQAPSGAAAATDDGKAALGAGMLSELFGIKQ